MKKKINDVKSQQLGIPISTATSRLKKNLMFSLVQKLEMDYCYRCGAKIDTVEELSVEHKEPWLYSENPIELFFDLDNVTFSHFECNSREARLPRHIVEKQEKAAKVLETNKNTCKECGLEKVLSDFRKNKTNLTGYSNLCKECYNKSRKKKK